MPALVARMLGETRTTTLQPEALDALPSGLFRTVGAASTVRAAARAVAEQPVWQEERQAVQVSHEAALGGITLELLDPGFEEAEAEAGCALEECLVSSQYSRPHSIFVAWGSRLHITPSVFAHNFVLFHALCLASVLRFAARSSRRELLSCGSHAPMCSMRGVYVWQSGASCLCDSSLAAP